MRIFWQAFCLAAGLALAILGYQKQEKSRLMEPQLVRGIPGSSKEEADFLAVWQGKEIPVTALLTAYSYTEEEAESAFDRLEEILPEEILGENSSLLQVSKDLKLSAGSGIPGITLNWKSSRPELIANDGTRQEASAKETGTEILLTVLMTTGNYSRSLTIPVRLGCAGQTGEEELSAYLREEIDRQQEETPSGALVRLPLSYRDEAITYRHAADRSYLYFPLLGGLAALLLALREKQEKNRKEKERTRQLMEDYPELVYQLMIYIGAGFPAMQALRRIYADRQRKRKEKPGLPDRPAYALLADLVRRMELGESERQLLEEYGRRCGRQEYRKLCGILEQARKNGAAALRDQLEAEMNAAWEKKKQLAKTAGEEAGTRLMAPLFLMLILVMFIIMVPALMTMG